ncbi:MAG TPA: hypothetical protein VGN23_15540 [Verrucomicrobiae bacterium]|jgi:hypothetical protein
MKKRKTIKYPPHQPSAQELKESAVAEQLEEPMVRTQIYLNRQEHDFIQREAKRRDEPMAAVIRGFIDEKMEIPEDAWTNNPIFQPWPHDSDWKGHEDGGVNLDHYLYGVPKDFIKVKGKWVEAPPLPKDYYENRGSRDAYDSMIKEMDESQ